MTNYITVEKATVEQWLEALESCLKEGEVTLVQYDAERSLRTALDAAEKVEPEWFIDEQGVPRRYTKHDFDQCEYGGLQRLYTHPAPAVSSKLTDMLCIIHRDGGQYIAEHGLEKAYEDACEKLHRWKVLDDELRAAAPGSAAG